MDINAISVLNASKPSRKVLTPFITIDTSAQNRSNKYCKHMGKEPACEALVAPSGLAYNTVVSIVRASSAKAQLVHNYQVQQVTTKEVSGDEMWSFVQKNRNNVCQRI